MHHRPMRDIIVRREPVCLPPEATVQDACRLMREHRIGAVMVADAEQNLLGIFTGRDAICRMLAECRDPATTRLADVMTHRPVTMRPQEKAIDALRLMRDSGFRHVPVVDGGRLVGIVSRGISTPPSKAGWRTKATFGSGCKGPARTLFYSPRASSAPTSQSPTESARISNAAAPGVGLAASKASARPLRSAIDRHSMAACPPPCRDPRRHG